MTNERSEQTPCEELGYKVGDKFTIIKGSVDIPNDHWESCTNHSNEAYLFKADDTYFPRFKSGDRTFFYDIRRLKKVESSAGNALITKFQKFAKMLTNGQDAILRVNKEGYSLSFDDYDFEYLTEEQVVEKMELLTKLFDLKGKADEQF